MTSPRKQYLQYVAGSIEEWMQDWIDLIEKNYLLIDDGVKGISQFLNLNSVYADYIKLAIEGNTEKANDVYDAAHANFDYTSCTVE